MKLILGMIGLALMLGVVSAKVFQTPSSLQVGTFTLAVPATNPSVTVNAPGKSGTLALVSDVPSLPTVPPGAQVVSGSAALGAVINLPGLSNPICTVTPRYSITGVSLTVSSVDYVCTQKNN